MAFKEVDDADDVTAEGGVVGAGRRAFRCRGGLAEDDLDFWLVYTYTSKRLIRAGIMVRKNSTSVDSHNRGCVSRSLQERHLLRYTT